MRTRRRCRPARAGGRVRAPRAQRTGARSPASANPSRRRRGVPRRRRGKHRRVQRAVAAAAARGEPDQRAEHVEDQEREADDAELAERLDVERVRVDDGRSPGCGARSRGSRRCLTGAVERMRVERVPGDVQSSMRPLAEVLDRRLRTVPRVAGGRLVDELVPAVARSRRARRARSRRPPRPRPLRSPRCEAPSAVAVDRRALALEVAVEQQQRRPQHDRGGDAATSTTIARSMALVDRRRPSSGWRSRAACRRRRP